MKRFRVKVVGLGLALVAGSAVAGDGEWRAPGAPAPPGAPELLPPALRAPGAPESGAIWLPARQPNSAPLVVPAAAVAPPAPGPGSRPSGPAPTPWPPAPPTAAGPRGGELPSGPLPLIPPIPAPDVVSRPEAPAPMVEVSPAPLQPDPAPAPRPVIEPMMPPPHAPEFLPVPKREPLPAPRPTDGSGDAPKPTQPTLPTAPPELMYPAGALEVNKHRTFGSAPISISRDYPALRSEISLDSDDPLAFANRGFVRAEYLLWWMPGYPVPVLATTNSNPNLTGYFGEPGTTAILGPGALVGSTRSGFRVRAGLWLNEGHSWGVDAGFFTLGNLSETAVRDSAQFPTITRPFFSPNVMPGSTAVIGEFGESVALPGILRGTLTARGESELWGADVNLRKCLFTKCDSRAELFAGYRHLNLRERLTITENITVIGDGAGRLDVVDPVGTRVVVQDRFATRNAFHGGQIGAYYEHRFGRWDVDARASVAFGTNVQTLDISATQVRTRPGMAPMVFTNGGLLAAGSNIGQFEQTSFGFVPELTLNVGYRITPRVRVFGGYNFLLWTNVIRPGDQIDRVVDLTFVPNAPAVMPSGQARPRPTFTQRDLVINGVQVGLELRW